MRQEAPRTRSRREEEEQGGIIRRKQEVRREAQGRLEICAEVGPNNRLGDSMAPSSYRSVEENTGCCREGSPIYFTF